MEKDSNIRNQAMFLSSFTPQEVSNFLKTENHAISEEVLTAIVSHKIDGEVFLQLNEEYLREIAPFLGDRIKLKRIISDIQRSLSLASFATVSSPVRDNPAHKTIAIAKCLLL